MSFPDGIFRPGGQSSGYFSLHQCVSRAQGRFEGTSRGDAPNGLSIGKYSSDIQWVGATRTGYRNTGSGVLNNSSTNGYTWSASLNGVNARNMNLNSSGVNPSNNNNRGNGFTVRCIQGTTRTREQDI